MDPNLVINHVLRLIRLDTTVFDEVRDDVNELVPAAVVAVISAFLAGLGAFLYWKVVPAFEPDKLVLNTLILGSIFLVAIYAVAVLVVYVVMSQAFKVQVDLYALFRTMGYAALPLSFSLFMFVPLFYPVFALVPLGLLLVSMIYAVQSATNADSRHVVLACVIAFAVMVFLLGLFAISTSQPNAPAGAGQFGLYFDFS